MRFYFHWRMGDKMSKDVEGLELPDLDAAVHEAIAAAREIMADRLKAGLPMDGQAFEIHDEAEEMVRSVPFKEAIPVE